MLFLAFFLIANLPAQTISKVTVSSKSSGTPNVSNFILTINGSGFGTSAAALMLRVSPQAGLLTPPNVNGVSPDGNTILASYTAPDDYEAKTVTVQVSGAAASDPYIITTAKTQSEMQKNVRVYRSILDPRIASDIFGRRIAKKFVVIQVTVTNRSKDFQFLIHDLSIDLRDVPALKFKERAEVSSVELSLLRGVAEKGQIYDPRNVLLRIMRGTGTVAAGIIGVAHFGPSYAPGVAAFNGPGLTAYDQALPDHTLNEMNRLNDSAYQANSIVTKQQSRVMAIFLPMAMFLDDADRKKFWKSPASLDPDKDLRKLGVYVDGNFIANVEDLVPSLTTAVIEPDEMKKFQSDNAEVNGYISGNYLTGTDVKLQNTDLPGAGIRLKGTPTDQRLEFTITSSAPVAPGQVLKIGVVKKETIKQADVTVQYMAAIPTLSAISPTSLKQGEQQTITLTGTNFLSGMQLLISPADGITVGKIAVQNSTTAQVQLTVASTAKTVARNVSVQATGQPSGTQSLNITQ